MKTLSRVLETVFDLLPRIWLILWLLFAISFMIYFQIKMPPFMWALKFVTVMSLGGILGLWTSATVAFLLFGTCCGISNVLEARCNRKQ